MKESNRLLNIIVNGHGYVFSPSSDNTLELLCRAFDLMKKYHLHSKGLRDEVAKVIGLYDCSISALIDYWNNWLGDIANSDRLDVVWANVLEYFKHISPAGYAFKQEGNAYVWKKL